MRLTRVTPPAVPLLTLAEVYTHLRLDPTAGSPPTHPDDDLLLTFIAAATDHLDGFTGVLGRALLTQTWKAEAAFPDYYGRFEIPMPVAGVISVETLKDGAYEAVSDALWTFRDMGSYAVVRPRNGMSWPLADHDEAAFRITLSAGYGDTADAVPAALKTAALMLMGAYYENREAVSTGNPRAVPMGVDALISPFRIRPNG